MEGKFDSLEQLFPGVHDRDANPSCVTMVWWNQSTACTEPREGWRSPLTQWHGSPLAPADPAVSTPTPPTRPSRSPSTSSEQGYRQRCAPGCSALRDRRSRPRRRARGRSSATGPRRGQRRWNGSTRRPNPRRRPAAPPDRRDLRSVGGWIRNGGYQSASRTERHPQSTSNGCSWGKSVPRRLSRTCQSVLLDVHPPPHTVIVLRTLRC
jgi:hypothetical protein